MKVRYLGDYYKVYLEKGKVYDAERVGELYCRIYDEDDGESYMYLLEDFEVVEE